MLERGYLAGNRSLAKATASGLPEAIEQGILHAIRSALRFARKRAQSEALRQGRIEERLARHLEAYTPDEDQSPILDEMRQIVLAALDLALEHQRIHPRDAEIIRTRITDSITQAELADRSGVSRQAIHQREKRGIKILRRVIQEREGGELQ